MKYTVHSMFEGGKYVYGIKPMPPKTDDVPVSADAPPIECAPFLAALD